MHLNMCYSVQLNSLQDGTYKRSGKPHTMRYTPPRLSKGSLTLLLKQLQMLLLLLFSESPTQGVNRRPLPTCMPFFSRAGLHGNVQANLLQRWHKVRQSRATQPSCTDVPDRVTTSAVQLAFWE